MSEKRDLRKDLEICKKATPGPWEYDGMHQEITTPHGDSYWLILSECRSAPDQLYKRDRFGHEYDANFAFIAAAREGWPHAINRAIKSEGFIEKLKLGVLYDELAQLRKSSRDCANCEFKANKHYQDKIATLTEENDKLRIDLDQYSEMALNLSAQVAYYKNEGEDVNAHNDHGDYYHRDVPASYTDKLEKQNAKLSAQVVGLREALEKIADPIKYLQTETERKPWAKINGLMIMGLVNDVNWIKGLAKEALSSPDPGAEIRERMAKLEKVAEYADALLKAIVAERDDGENIPEIQPWEEMLYETLADMNGGGERD